MAESIILHFRSGSAQAALARLGVLTEKTPERETHFYPTNAEYVLIISPYEDTSVEYDESELAQLNEMLGGRSRPHEALVFELRRSRSTSACDAAVKIIRLLAPEFPSVIDDGHRLWLCRDALERSDFLSQYRYGD